MHSTPLTQLRQLTQSRDGHTPVAANFDAVMSGLYSFVEAVLAVRKSLRMVLVKPLLHCLMQLVMIGFEGQDVICLLLDNLGGNRLLRAHGINCNDAALDIQQL